MLENLTNFRSLRYLTIKRLITIVKATKWYKIFDAYCNIEHRVENTLTRIEWRV